MEYNDEIGQLIANLIANLEPIVGQFYHNEQKRGGFFFRYPVQFTRDGTSYSCRGGYIPDLTPEELPSLHYKTGANSLYIGVALFHVLKFLEDRYEGKLDFAKLEMEYQLNSLNSFGFSLASFGFFDNGDGIDDEDDGDDLYDSDNESE